MQVENLGNQELLKLKKCAIVGSANDSKIKTADR